MAMTNAISLSTALEGVPTPGSPEDSWSTTSAASAKASRPFRVIISGGGVGGLVISHALTRAGIDHVVLEKGIVAPDWGASISIWAHGARIFQQIGCWEALRAACLPLKMIYVRGQDGKAYSAEPYFEMMLKRNGFDWLTMERKDFLRIIYEQHPDKRKIKEGKRVVDVDDREDGVTVKLSDGSVEEGDILIGCDGVHSTVRELMWRNANTSIPNMITAREKTSQVTIYRALVGVSKPIPGMGGVRDMHWITHWGLSFLILTQPDKIFFFVNWKMPQKLCWPSKAKWNDDDAEAAAATVAHLPVSDSVVFGELWKNKIRGHLLGLQEGIFDHWSFGRLVLAGDSAHKVTPNLALGAMCCMESSVILVNKIVDMHTQLGAERRPSKAVIETLLKDYQAERMPRQKEASEASALLTRLHAYDGWHRWFLMRWVFPHAGGQTFIADLMADLCARAPKFNFLPVVYSKTATYKWQDDMDHHPVQLPKRSSWLLNVKMKNAMGLEFFACIFVILLLSLIFKSGTEKAISSTIRIYEAESELGLFNRGTGF
ncbi:hypothetical protein DL769_003494 [Monosporascus sp. CRB-8-3]|nr:hypothetical protein DL769_003494 [Monosporascus sp. CRB-8-3]